MSIQPLDETQLAAAAAELARRDPDLRAVLERYGLPPLWARAPGFATLIRIILEQQVSLASAAAAFGRLQTALGQVTPAAFLTLDEVQLKIIGFSRQPFLPLDRPRGPRCRQASPPDPKARQDGR